MTTSLTMSARAWAALSRILTEFDRTHRFGIDAIWLCADNDGALVAALDTPHSKLRLWMDTPAPEPGFAEVITARMLNFIEVQADELEDITVDFDEDGTATAVVERISLAIDRPGSIDWRPEVDGQPTRAMVTTTARDLFRGFAAIGRNPVETPGESLEDAVLWCSIVGAGELVLSREWPGDGPGRSTVRVPATIDEAIDAPVHAMTRNLYPVGPFIREVAAGEDVVAIDLGSDEGYSIEFGGDHWNLRVRAEIPAAMLAMAAVCRRLDDMEVDYELLDATSLVVGSAPTFVRVDANGRTDVSIRCSSVIARDITPSEHLYAELNEINLGLAGMKAWFHEGKIILGVDLATDDPGSILATVSELFSRATELGPVLRPFAASEPD